MTIEQETATYLQQQLDKAIKGQAIWGDMKNFDPTNSDHRGQLCAILQQYSVDLSFVNLATDENVSWGIQKLEQLMPNVDILTIVIDLYRQFANELELLTQNDPDTVTRIAMTPRDYHKLADYWEKIRAISIKEITPPAR